MYSEKGAWFCMPRYVILVVLLGINTAISYVTEPFRAL